MKILLGIKWDGSRKFVSQTIFFISKPIHNFPANVCLYLKEIYFILLKTTKFNNKFFIPVNF